MDRYVVWPDKSGALFAYTAMWIPEHVFCQMYNCKLSS